MWSEGEEVGSWAEDVSWSIVVFRLHLTHWWTQLDRPRRMIGADQPDMIFAQLRHLQILLTKCTHLSQDWSLTSFGVFTCSGERDARIISCVERHKLASLEATLIWNCNPASYSLMGVRCRATSIAKNFGPFQWRFDQLFRWWKTLICDQWNGGVISFQKIFGYIPLPRLYSPCRGWSLQKISDHIGL